MKRLMVAALQLVEQGFYVFPLRPRDKRPLPHFKQWEKRATRDQDIVYQWWSDSPYNIGVATGPSQLLVIDCDTATDSATVDWRQEEDEVAILRRQLPKTFSVRTPSGGLHLYFTAHKNVPLGNTASRLGKHVDTRGAGGYIVGPGSVCSGRIYVVVDHAPIAPLPTWITELLVPRQPSRAPVASRQRVAGHYLRAILEGEGKRVRSATPGSRNDALNTAAFILGQLVGSGGITEEHAWSLLRNAAQVHVGVNGFTEGEVELTIESGLAAGMQRPRCINQQR
jgi:Bifunctional DNA primase/polymerase, N-terminal